MLDVINNGIEAVAEWLGDGAEAVTDVGTDCCEAGAGIDVPHTIMIDGEVCTEISPYDEPQMFAAWREAAKAAGVMAPGKIFFKEGCTAGVIVNDPANPNDDIGVMDPRIFHQICKKHGKKSVVSILGHECGHQWGALSGTHACMSDQMQELDSDTMAVMVAEKTGSPLTGFNDILRNDPGDDVHPNGAFRVMRANLQSRVIKKNAYNDFVPPDKNPFIALALRGVNVMLGVG